jgi:hypothetical protein
MVAHACKGIMQEKEIRDTVWGQPWQKISEIPYLNK